MTQKTPSVNETCGVSGDEVRGRATRMAGVEKKEGAGSQHPEKHLQVSTRRRKGWHRDLWQRSRMRRAGSRGTKQSFKKEAEIHKGQGYREIKR